MTAGIPDADYATTMATLERIAKNVGLGPREAAHAPRARTWTRPHRGHQPKRGLA